MPLARASPSAPAALVDASEAVSARDWAVAAMRAALISAIVGSAPVAPCPAASRRTLAIDALRLPLARGSCRGQRTDGTVDGKGSRPGRRHSPRHVGAAAHRRLVCRGARDLDSLAARGQAPCHTGAHGRQRGVGLQGPAVSRELVEGGCEGGVLGGRRSCRGGRRCWGVGRTRQPALALGDRRRRRCRHRCCLGRLPAHDVAAGRASPEHHDHDGCCRHPRMSDHVTAPLKTPAPSVPPRACGQHPFERSTKCPYDGMRIRDIRIRVPVRSLNPASHGVAGVYSRGRSTPDGPTDRIRVGGGNG